MEEGLLLSFVLLIVGRFVHEQFWFLPSLAGSPPEWHLDVLDVFSVQD